MKRARFYQMWAKYFSRNSSSCSLLLWRQCWRFHLRCLFLHVSTWITGTRWKLSTSQNQLQISPFRCYSIIWSTKEFYHETWSQLTDIVPGHLYRNCLFPNGPTIRSIAIFHVPNYRDFDELCCSKCRTHHRGSLWNWGNLHL